MAQSKCKLNIDTVLTNVKLHLSTIMTDDRLLSVSPSTYLATHRHAMVFTSKLIVQFRKMNFYDLSIDIVITYVLWLLIQI